MRMNIKDGSNYPVNKSKTMHPAITTTPSSQDRTAFGGLPKHLDAEQVTW